jgi:hypothetical protein
VRGLIKHRDARHKHRLEYGVDAEDVSLIGDAALGVLETYVGLTLGPPPTDPPANPWQDMLKIMRGEK